MTSNHFALLAAAALLVAVVTGCSSIGEMKASSPLDSAAWLESGGLEHGWSRTSEGFATEVSYGSGGAGTTHSRSTTPGVPGATAVFPFSYSIDGAQVTVVFEDGMQPDETFEVIAVSDSSFTARPVGATGTINHGTWTR